MHEKAMRVEMNDNKECHLSSAPFAENAFSFPLHRFCPKSSVHRYVGLLLVFIFTPLINLPVFMLIPCSFYYYSSVVQLEDRNGDVSRRSIIV